MIAEGGVTYPEPDVTNCGGVTVFMKVAHLAEAFNLPVTSHGAHDVTVHLLAPRPIAAISKRMASASTPTLPSRSRCARARRSRPTGPATASHSSGPTLSATRCDGRAQR